jgi:biotin carboxylase
MKKKVLILGAARYYCRCIETAKKTGYVTHVLDKNPNAPGFGYADEYGIIDITACEEVLAYAQKHHIDGVVPINDYGVYTASYVANRMGLPGMDLSVAKTVTNKAALRMKWEETHQPNPQFFIAKNINEAKSSCREIGFPVIFKPTNSKGGGSRGVIYVSNESDVDKAHTFSTSFYQDKTILVEEYIEGLEHSAEVIFYEGKGHVLAVSDKIKTPLPARVDKSVIYPTKVKGSQLDKLQTVIIEAVESLGFKNGCAHVECCTLPTGEIKLFELGARPGGGGTADPIVSFLTGINEFVQFMKICIGEKPSLSTSYTKGCVYHFIIPKPGKIKKIEGLEDILKWPNILDADLFVKKGDIIREVRTGLDRSGFIIAGGHNRQEALELTNKAEARIRFIYE